MFESWTKKRHLVDSMSSAKRARTTKSATESKEPTAQVHSCLVDRPPIRPLDLGWVKAARVNSASVNRRAGEIGTRRTVKKDWQAAWELRAITCELSHSPYPSMRPCLTVTGAGTQAST